VARRNLGVVRENTIKVDDDSAEEMRAEVGLERQTSAPVVRSACMLVAVTGAVSMGLELLASRCLSLIFGASLQAFAVVLIAFILGIGLGSVAVAQRKGRVSAFESITIVAVLIAAVWVGLIVLNIERLVELYRYARSGLSRTAMGYRYYEVMATVFSMLVLGLPAAALGGVLPLWLRTLSQTPRLGHRVGRLLTWNTLGAVCGVLLTGFVVMPTLGIRGSFAALALALCAGAIFISWRTTRQRMTFAAGIVGFFLIIVTLIGNEGWRLVLTSGIFRVAENEPTSGTIRELRRFDRLLFYEDAADATVSVDENGPQGNRQLMLRINGKTDASSHADLSTQYLLAHLPLMIRPNSKDVFVFGMGSGITAGAVLTYPIERLTVAENCEPVLKAAKFFEPWNNGVLTNERTHIHREDARTVLKLDRSNYDVIIAEPSNPWTVGVGSVFTYEFYKLAASRLKPGGIIAQWFHVYEMQDDLVELVLRTFGQVFNHMEVWDAQGGDLILLGSNGSWKSDVDLLERALKCDGPRQQLAQIGLTSPASILARQFASQRTAFAVSGPGPIQTDDAPILEYQAPKAAFFARRSQFLNRFDERTWQAGLAPGEKNLLLAELDDATLQAVFGRGFGSVNSHVLAYVTALSEENPGRRFERVGGGNSVPFVFDGKNNIALRPPAARGTDQVARELFLAEQEILSNGPRRDKALEKIEAILESPDNGPPEGAGWSATYYVCLASSASLHDRKVEQAKRIILHGVELVPDSQVIQYLVRVLTREGIIHPGERFSSKDKTFFEKWEQ